MYVRVPSARSIAPWSIVMPCGPPLMSWWTRRMSYEPSAGRISEVGYPSLAAGVWPPCRWTTEGRSSSLRCRTTVRRPERETIVGPGKVPPYVHALVRRPGRISSSAWRWVISYVSVVPLVDTGSRTRGTGRGVRKAAGRSALLVSILPGRPSRT